MRKYLFMFIGLMFTMKGFSQTYHPIPTDSVYWVEQENGLHWSLNCYYNKFRCVYPVGDVMIGGYSYTEYRFNAITNYYPIIIGSACEPSLYETNQMYAFLRNDIINKKVYAYDSVGTHADVLLYDFSLNIGDTIYPISLWNGSLPQCPGDTFVLAGIDSIDIGGEYRKRYSYDKNAFTNDSVVFIEGIGTDYGLAYNVYCPFEVSTQLICFDNNGLHYSPQGFEGHWACTRSLSFEEDQYTAQQFIFPVSNTEYSIHNEDNNSIEITCYDMLGKFMLKKSFHESGYLDLSEIPSGVYVMYIEYNGSTISPYKFVITH